jgi:hypothetical protein
MLPPVQQYLKKKKNKIKRTIEIKTKQKTSLILK